MTSHFLGRLLDWTHRITQEPRALPAANIFPTEILSFSPFIHSSRRHRGFGLLVPMTSGTTGPDTPRGSSWAVVSHVPSYTTASSVFQLSMGARESGTSDLTVGKVQRTTLFEAGVNDILKTRIAIYHHDNAPQQEWYNIHSTSASERSKIQVTKQCLTNLSPALRRSCCQDRLYQRLKGMRDRDLNHPPDRFQLRCSASVDILPTYVPSECLLCDLKPRIANWYKWIEASKRYPPQGAAKPPFRHTINDNRYNSSSVCQLAAVRLISGWFCCITECP
ncbi:hypothetical protein PLEOSDRAFT_167231 [Pleurotus ostreatus PC15]|uniref:Uncharacterized protein n=1 Tax=Pleurotus ostreatus (strain PC15) TaxID=1137138 RepID=A0A067P026_PLEO1|nr:hypothetical protein PLEOSDRAFT_167231 [Pleurotus ostreatus PC15]